MPQKLLPKTLTSLSAIAILIMGSAGGPASSAETLPTRKGGLWEQNTTMDQGEGPREHTMTLCIDESMEKLTVFASIKHHKDNCTKYEIKNSDGTTVVDSDCVLNDRPVTSTTKMTGDFQSGFQIEIETRTTLSDNGRSRVMTRHISQMGKYLGADCGDLKPGEAKGSNGDRIMVQ